MDAPICQSSNLGIVRDHNQRLAPGTLQFAQDIQHFGSGMRVKIARRLVR
jgi:hypothetical protein